MKLVVDFFLNKMVDTHEIYIPGDGHETDFLKMLIGFIMILLLLLIVTLIILCRWRDKGIKIIKFQSLLFYVILTPALNSSYPMSKIYSAHEFAPHKFKWAEYEQI